MLHLSRRRGPFLPSVGVPLKVGTCGRSAVSEAGARSQNESDDPAETPLGIHKLTRTSVVLLPKRDPRAVNLQGLILQTPCLQNANLSHATPNHYVLKALRQISERLRSMSEKVAKNKPPAHGSSADVLGSGGSRHPYVRDYHGSAGMVPDERGTHRRGTSLTVLTLQPEPRGTSVSRIASGVT